MYVTQLIALLLFRWSRKIRMDASTLTSSASALHLLDYRLPLDSLNAVEDESDMLHIYNGLCRHEFF